MISEVPVGRVDAIWLEGLYIAGIPDEPSSDKPAHVPALPQPALSPSLAEPSWHLVGGVLMAVPKTLLGLPAPLFWGLHCTALLMVLTGLFFVLGRSYFHGFACGTDGQSMNILIHE